MCFYVETLVKEGKATRRAASIPSHLIDDNPLNNRKFYDEAPLCMVHNHPAAPARLEVAGLFSSWVDGPYTSCITPSGSATRQLRHAWTSTTHPPL